MTAPKASLESLIAEAELLVPFAESGKEKWKSFIISKTWQATQLGKWVKPYQAFVFYGKPDSVTSFGYLNRHAEAIGRGDTIVEAVENLLIELRKIDPKEFLI